MGNTQVIVGGGAAGYFCANSIAEFNPNIRIKLLETDHKPSEKLRFPVVEDAMLRIIASIPRSCLEITREVRKN